VRGYREEQFVAPQVAWSNIEYRLLLGPSGWFGPFLDLGYYEDDTPELIYGWGLGMGLTSRIGLVTIHYGLGKGDSFGNGKVHLSISARF
jgi:outer membrane translocation and assembly module TamA